MIWFIVPVAICVMIAVIVVKSVRDEWRDRGDDDDPWNWRGWSGPDDWPDLPPLPKGSGPTPDYVPDEWVFEELGPPRKLTKVEPPEERS